MRTAASAARQAAALKDPRGARHCRSRLRRRPSRRSSPHRQQRPPAPPAASSSSTTPAPSSSEPGRSSPSVRDRLAGMLSSTACYDMSALDDPTEEQQESEDLIGRGEERGRCRERGGTTVHIRRSGGSSGARGARIGCGRRRRCSLNMCRRPASPPDDLEPPSGPSDGGTTQHYQQPPLLRPQQPPSTSSQPTSAPPQPPSSLAPSLHQRPACSASSSTWQQQTGQSQPPRAAQIDWERPQGISECVPTNKPTRPHRAGTRRADGPSELPPSERSTAGSRVPPPDALSRSPANVNRRCACAAAASAAAAALNRRPQEAPAHGGEGSCSSCGGALLPSIPLEYHSQPAHRMYEPRQQQQAAPPQPHTQEEVEVVYPSAGVCLERQARRR